MTITSTTFSTPASKRPLRRKRTRRKRSGKTGEISPPSRERNPLVSATESWKTAAPPSALQDVDGARRWCCARHWSIWATLPDSGPHARFSSNTLTSGTPTSPPSGERLASTNIASISRRTFSSLRPVFFSPGRRHAMRQLPAGVFERNVRVQARAGGGHHVGRDLLQVPRPDDPVAISRKSSPECRPLHAPARSRFSIFPSAARCSTTPGSAPGCCFEKPLKKATT